MLDSVMCDNVMNASIWPGGEGTNESFAMGSKVSRHFSAFGALCLILATTADSVAQEALPTRPPLPPDVAAQGVPDLLGWGEMLSFRALPVYQEPAWVNQTYVVPGLLPPLDERLPHEPLVYAAAAMPDGIGV